MRGYAEYVNLLSGQALGVSGKTVISDPLPMGEGWYRAMLRIGIVLTVGTASGPITEGELLIVKNVLLKTDRGEVICNLPGRALYKIACVKGGIVAPRKDAIAAASATYYVNLPIYFASHYRALDRPEDTILDTQRYSSCTLEVTMGTVADLFTTPGTATITCTLDMEVVRTKGILPGDEPGVGGRPVAHISYDYRQPADANSVTQIFLERAQDLSIQKLFIFSGTSGSAGVPCSGANSDAIQNVVQLKDQSGFISKDRIHRMIQESNQMDFSLESIITGLEVHDFVQEGSTQAALTTAGKNLLQYSWTNQGGVGANSIITAVHEGMRSLK